MSQRKQSQKSRPYDDIDLFYGNVSAGRLYLNLENCHLKGKRTGNGQMDNIFMILKKK